MGFLFFHIELLMHIITHLKVLFNIQQQHLVCLKSIDVYSILKGSHDS